MLNRLCLLALGAFYASASFAIPGRVTVIKNGHKSVIPVTLDIPANWEGPITLTTKGVAHIARQYTYIVNEDNTHEVAIGFTGLPETSPTTLVVFKGTLTTTRYDGRVLAGKIDADLSDEKIGFELHRILKSANDGGFTTKGSFVFDKNLPAPGDTIYSYPRPPTGYDKKGIPIYRGFAPSGDPSNPCPEGPCWTDAGVGRRIEYYAGPIQNPYYGRPAAGFNIGVPSHMNSIYVPRRVYPTAPFGSFPYPYYNWFYFWSNWYY
jgi:hypothetical protein